MGCFKLQGLKGKFVATIGTKRVIKQEINMLYFVAVYNLSTSLVWNLCLTDFQFS